MSTDLFWDAILQPAAPRRGWPRWAGAGSLWRLLEKQWLGAGLGLTAGWEGGGVLGTRGDITDAAALSSQRSWRRDQGAALLYRRDHRGLQRGTDPSGARLSAGPPPGRGRVRLPRPSVRPLSSHGAHSLGTGCWPRRLEGGHCGPWPLAADLPLRREPLRALHCLRPASCSAGRPGHPRRARSTPGHRSALEGPSSLPGLPGSQWVPGLGSEPGENSRTCITRVYLGTEKHSFKKELSQKGKVQAPPRSPGALVPEGDLQGP